MNQPYGQTPNPYDPTRVPPMHQPMPPAPGGHAPPSWPPGPPGPPPRGNRRLIWLLVGLVCVLSVVAVVLTMSLIGRNRDETPKSTTASAGPEDHSPVPVSALEGLLPDKDVVRDAVADAALGVVDKGEAMFNAIVVEPTCQGLNFIAAGPVYAGSGWTTVRWQIWNSPAELEPANLTHQLLTSVVGYPSAHAARAFFDKQGTAWRSCSERTVNMRITNMENTTDSFWTVGTVTDSDGVVSTTEISEGGGGWSCQLTMGLRNNVITQVNICGETTPATAAQQVLDSINQKIDAAA